MYVATKENSEKDEIVIDESTVCSNRRPWECNAITLRRYTEGRVSDEEQGQIGTYDSSARYARDF